jgi:hypothetical protein
MNFHLDVQLPAFSTKLKYKEPLLFIGSCFAENIALRMQSHKFNTCLNPHGVMYNPESIARAIHHYLINKKYTEEDLFFARDCYHSWDHHSRFSTTNAATCLAEINDQITRAHEALKNAGWLFITLGSAYIYRHKQTGKRIANCHKQPQQEFVKELLTVEELVKMYKELIIDLEKYNKQLKIVFTVSPVRYIRDGIVENTLSKARLIELVHRLTDNKNLMYFPAYELVIDDLRDYRFYKEDLVHPTDQAIDYVFEKLRTSLFDETTTAVFEKINDIVKAKAHRVFQVDTEAHQKFKATYFNRCKQLQQQYPFLLLEEELDYFADKKKV